mmetsp:Transcript_7134/g.11073  ORF Transcript_7134/g.11073 Transcript_7134/m.11073 type:complete len:113 (+) Transcript_7134:809-1147(+)
MQYMTQAIAKMPSLLVLCPTPMLVTHRTEFTRKIAAIAWDTRVNIRSSPPLLKYSAIMRPYMSNAKTKPPDTAAYAAEAPTNHFGDMSTTKKAVKNTRNANEEVAALKPQKP